MNIRSWSHKLNLRKKTKSLVHFYKILTLSEFSILHINFYQILYKISVWKYYQLLDLNFYWPQISFLRPMSASHVLPFCWCHVAYIPNKHQNSKHPIQKSNWSIVVSHFFICVPLFFSFSLRLSASKVLPFCYCRIILLHLCRKH